ncbi:MAG: HD domain-containing protein [Bacteroidetes bacterium]|nr:HD domain-containing protein [Bacteroidota bacterium]
MSLSLKDIAAHGHVRRWHTARVRREQTLGEHVGLVAMIALELLRAASSVEGWSCASLIEAALFHDAPETEFGDTPSPAKSFFLNKLGLPVDRATEEAFWGARGQSGGPLSSLRPSLQDILRHADLLEAWLFYRQEGLDPQKMAAIQADLDAAHERLSPALKAASLAMVNRYLREVA